MAKKVLTKFCARLLQKGINPSEIPEDVREDAIALAETLPLREDMKPVEEVNTEEVTEVVPDEETKTDEE